MNWSSFPYFRIAISFTAGIFVFEYFAIAEFWANGLLCTFLSLYILSEWKMGHPGKKSVYSSILMLLSVFLLGGFVLNHKKSAMSASTIPCTKNDIVVVKAKIKDKIKAENKLKFEMHIYQYSSSGKSVKTNGNNTWIAIFDKDDSLAATYTGGDVIIAKAKIRNIVSPKNPESFDYASYLFYKGILQTLTVSKTHHHLILGNTNSIFTKWAGNSSAFVSATIRKYFKDTTAIAVAEALLIGQKFLLSQEIYKAYSDTGAIHVLSVSGLHVAIFMSLFIWLFSLWQNTGIGWKIFRIFALIIIAWFYVIMTGMSPSVVRAGTMVSIYIIGKNFFKGTNNFNIISVSAILMLIFNPLYLFQASFQFSYISLLSILYFQPKIKQWWTPESKVLQFLWDLVNVSVSAQILIFPFSVFIFHQFPTYFLLSGIIAVPVVTVIIYLGSVMILIEVLFEGLNSVVSPVIESLIIFLNKIIHYISELPYAKVDQIWLSEFSLFLIVLFLILFIIWLETRSIKSFHISLMVLLLIIFENRFSDFTAKENTDIVIYDLYRGYLIDGISGKSLRSSMSAKVDEKTVNFAASNHRIQQRIAVIKPQSVGDKFIRVGKDILYIYNDERDFSRLKHNIHISVLFITKSKNNLPDNILNKINADVVVADKNIPKWVRQKWVTLRDEGKFRVHFLDSDGPFILSDFRSKVVHPF